MKIKYYFGLFIVTLLISSFTRNNSNLPPSKTYNFFYVDNSNAKNYESFTPAMFDLVEQKVDLLKDDKGGYIGFFLSNGLKPDFASNYKGAKNIIGRLSSGSSNSTPNSFFDKASILNGVLSSDLSYTKAINMHFFVSESFIMTDLMSGNAGMLLNVLPSELQNLLSCDEEKINVYIYYPATSTKLKPANLESFCNFSKSNKDFSSKIKFHIEGI